MPILDLQRQLRRLGKIRMGDQQATKAGKTRPAKLTEWRLTSPSRELLEAAAAIYGGEVGPWDNAPGEATQYQLYTQTDTLDIIVPPAGALTQWYEMWSAGGCQRRCDGATEQLSGEACMCPADPDERRVAAAQGKACKITTRLSVILPRIPDIGMWMLECHGYYGAVELAGADEILRLANSHGNMVPARLRIDQRTQKRDGQTQHYIVPVVELPTLTAGTLMTGEVPSQIAQAPQRSLPPTRPPEGRQVSETKPLPAKVSSRPRPPLPGEDVDPAAAAAARDVATRKSRLMSIVGRVAEDKRGLLAKDWAKEGLPERDKFAALTPEQLPKAEALIHQWVALSVLAASGVTAETDRHAVVGAATKGATESTKGLTAEQLDAVIAYCEPPTAEPAGEAHPEAGRDPSQRSSTPRQVEHIDSLIEELKAAGDEWVEKGRAAWKAAGVLPRGAAQLSETEADAAIAALQGVFDDAIEAGAVGAPAQPDTDGDPR